MEKPKNYDDFEATLQQSEPNREWPAALKSLWYDAKGDWEASHDIAQDLHNDTGSWIHAYLHRKEGDEFNAGYWYRRANRDFPKMTLNEEHRVITESILTR
ncbi:hypothetical protein RQM65_17665 [Pricia sp. S334]|uniref:Uncharacterized protein n=1 Tax=Pricia mediterranea TaxID=3076079 RepID=A0ABU3L9T1_9FLAO|nr:hypothetical protein [Pricia sp. S334]MDT7830501.1 hypothetical protein [Pricia sp. S334]